MSYPRLYRIEGTLFQSAKLCDIPEDRQEHFIREKNIRAVFNLWHTQDEIIRRALGEHYWHIYIPDGKLNKDAVHRLLFIAQKGAEYVKSNIVTLSHCYGGRNRSGLLNALILTELYDIDGTEAMRRVMLARPNSLVNMNYAAFLNTFKGRYEWKLPAM